jgi:hypothetical protein
MKDSESGTNLVMVESIFGGGVIVGSLFSMRSFIGLAADPFGPICLRRVRPPPPFFPIANCLKVVLPLSLYF